MHWIVLGFGRGVGNEDRSPDPLLHVTFLQGHQSGLLTSAVVVVWRKVYYYQCTVRRVFLIQVYCHHRATRETVASHVTLPQTH